VEELAKTQKRTDIAVREMQGRTDITVREEHATTRSEIVDEVHLANAHSREAQEIARQEIAQLQQALNQLSEEMRQRDAELKGLLTDFAKTGSSKKRKILQERSNAVSATLFALETVYRSLQVYILDTKACYMSDGYE